MEAARENRCLICKFIVLETLESATGPMEQQGNGSSSDSSSDGEDHPERGIQGQEMSGEAKVSEMTVTNPLSILGRSRRMRSLERCKTRQSIISEWFSPSRSRIGRSSNGLTKKRPSASEGIAGGPEQWSWTNSMDGSAVLGPGEDLPRGPPGQSTHRA